MITVFVSNIPASMHWKGLWAFFSFHGKVVDAFISEKKSKGDMRFGFVRYANYSNARRAISRLNGFVILGSRIWVREARFKGNRTIWRRVVKHRNSSYSEESNKKRLDNVGRGKEGKGKIEDEWNLNLLERSSGVGSGLVGMKMAGVVQGHVEDELLWKYQKCLVGEVASFYELKSLADRITRMGLGDICVKRIQGNFFLIEIQDEELLEILKQREWSYLKEFFINIEPWSERLVFSERITWIEVSGVPMHYWNYETFKRIAGKWGNLVSMGENLLGTNNFEKVEMLISISQVKKIDEIVLLEVGDVRFLVSVREESEPTFGVEPEKGLDGTRIVSSESIMENAIENVSEGKACQEMSGELIEGVAGAVSVGISAKVGAGVSRPNSGMDQAYEDVANMGLVLGLGQREGQVGLVDIDERLGSLRIEGHLKGREILPIEDQIFPVDNFNLAILEAEDRDISQEVEEEFYNTIRKIQRRDRNRRKGKSNAEPGSEEKVVNLSLSDSDLSNKRKVILREAKQTWEVGKKLGLRVQGEERDVTEKIMRLEEQ
ncbi:hypothetical protein CXB51_014853 [Gossypium anomalum]|uniref:RRM domain-containing protein n=1 Tax=Gossypium anomalum TaxID=47600 RepID=A0A8J5YRY7_9ROSI|nr:hypothetical protein CXB51_014853 [Gossypium anomalum]